MPAAGGVGAQPRREGIEQQFRLGVERAVELDQGVVGCVGADAGDVQAPLGWFGRPALVRRADEDATGDKASRDVFKGNLWQRRNKPRIVQVGQRRRKRRAFPPSRKPRQAAPGACGDGPEYPGESRTPVHRVRPAKCSASRSASATIVKVGLAALEAGNKDEPAT